MSNHNINVLLNAIDLNESSIPLILIDETGLILWSNKAFHDQFPLPESSNFFAQFEIESKTINSVLSFQEIQLNKNENILLRIFQVESNLTSSKFLIEIAHQKFPTISTSLEKLIKQLLDESDLTKFCSTVLSELRIITNSDKNFIVLLENDKVLKLIAEINDKYDLQEIKIVINSTLKPLKKWFSINKNIFLIENDVKSIGYQINKLLESDFVFISPSFSEDNLIALTFFFKADKNLSSLESEILNVFSNIISLGNDLISIKQKNAAVESQLKNSQKLETVGKFASGLAHDFNNLLASIFGSINLLRKGLNDNPNAVKLLDNIENCSLRARDLTKGILSFGKPTQSRKEIVFFDNVLNELLKVIKETFPHNIKINFEIGDSLYKVLGNSTEIYQILLNLCVNAKEAINQDGLITVKAENIIVDDSNIFLFPFLNKGHFVKISVSDNGSGIDEENLLKIFEPYFSTKQKDTGSGLGLYITSQLVKAMNGYIDVESNLYQGTTFRIYFPAVMLKESRPSAIKEKIIMLADDEEMLNDLLGDLLESNGFYVLKVNNTKEVFRILNEEVKVDLLIIDYNLPETSGIDCVAKLRELGLDMPVILASGASNFDNLQIQKARINQTLQKPYEFEMILETIKKLLTN